MPKKEFALEPGGPKRVALSWRGLWKDFQVTLDGALLGRLESRKELEAGGTFTLADGSHLKVQLKREALGQELRVLLNGVPLPGSASEPAQRVATAAGVLYFVAGLNAALGVLAELARIALLQNMGLGYASVVVGAIYAGLGYLVKSKHSRIALVIGIALFALDGIASIFLHLQPGNPPPVGGIVARVFLLVPLWKGLGAFKELKSAPPT